MRNLNKNTGKTLLRLFSVLIILVLLPTISSAQEETGKSSSTRTQIKSLNDSSMTNEEAEAAIEKVKNKNPLTVNIGLQGSLLEANDPWISTSGGDNSISLLSSASLSYVYAKNNFRMETSASARFGYNRISTEVTTDGETTKEPIWFKYQDELNISLAPSIKFSDNWSYGGTVKFRTQFALGYESRLQQESIDIMSGFMAPGYLDISGGLVWCNLRESTLLTVRISPIAMSAVYVCNEDVRTNFTYQLSSHDEENFTYADPYGVPYQDKSKYEGGSSFQIDLELALGQKGAATYKSSLYSFYGWFTQVTYDNTYRSVDDYTTAIEQWSGTDDGTLRPMLSIMPTLRWENTLNIKMTKVLSTTIDYRLYFNRAQSSSLQTQTMLNIGLTYSFSNQHNKK